MSIRFALLALAFFYWHIGLYSGLALVAAVLAWPFVRIAGKAWLAGYFGAKGLRAALSPKRRRWPRAPRRIPPSDYYSTDRLQEDMPTPRVALRRRRVKQLPAPVPFDDGVPF